MEIQLNKFVKVQVLLEELVQFDPSFQYKKPDLPNYIAVRSDFIGGVTVQTLLLPDSTDPQVIQTYIDLHDESSLSESELFKDKVIAIAQSTVGIKLVDLTQVQIKALFAAVLYKAGGIDPKTMTVNPLKDWL